MKTSKDYIVFPLDLPDSATAMSYVERLKDHVGLFKVGLELFISEGPPILRAIRDAGGAGIFLDLKLHDIPATMKRAFLAASRHGPEWITVHCDEGNGFLKEIADANPGKTKILGITLLTSLNQENAVRLGYSEKLTKDLSRMVLLRARIAMEAGCHGVVCSGQEVAMLKRELGKDLVVMTPGIRPKWAVVGNDDQKRVVTAGEAVANGADYIVIGRPIRDAKDPVEAAKRLAEEIGEVI
jgi:orotidine-5'-phosphate decarboxylase